MVYGNTDEIFEALATTRRRLFEQVESLSDEAAGSRFSSETWSVAEIIEHLSTTEPRVVKLLGGLLAQQTAAAAGAGAAAGPISIQVMTDRAGEKFVAPESFVPTGNVPLSQSLAKLRDARTALLEMRPRIEAADYSRVNYPHPIFGPLNVYQWVAVVEFHECKHLAQIQSMREPARWAAD